MHIYIVRYGISIRDDRTACASIDCKTMHYHVDCLSIVGSARGTFVALLKSLFGVMMSFDKDTCNIFDRQCAHPSPPIVPPHLTHFINRVDINRSSRDRIYKLITTL